FSQQTTHPLSQEDVLLLVLQQFRDSLSPNHIAGFHNLAENGEAIAALEYYDASKDKLWSKLKKKHLVNTARTLHIVTYGTQFLVEPPAQCERVFPAATLSGSTEKRSMTRKFLVQFRGDDGRVQFDVRQCALFDTFLEQIVEYIERHDAKVIGV